LERELLAEFLPDFMLDYFEIVDLKKLGNIISKQIQFELHLDEKSCIHKEIDSSEYESKGFLPSSRV